MLAGTIRAEIVVYDIEDDVEIYEQKFVANIDNNEPLLLLALLHWDLSKQLNDYISERAERLNKVRQENKNS